MTVTRLSARLLDLLQCLLLLLDFSIPFKILFILNNCVNRIAFEALIVASEVENVAPCADPSSRLRLLTPVPVALQTAAPVEPLAVGVRTQPVTTPDYAALPLVAPKIVVNEISGKLSKAV